MMSTGERRAEEGEDKDKTKGNWNLSILETNTSEN